MTQSVRNPSPSTVPVEQAWRAAGFALDIASLGIEGLVILEGLLKAAATLDDKVHAAAVARAGAVIAELYLAPLYSQRDDAQRFADALHAGGAA